MAKTKRKTPLWLILTQGSLLAMVMYFLGLMGLSSLLVNGRVGEGRVFPAVLLLGAVAAFLAGTVTARRCILSPLMAGLAVGGCFALSLALAGLGCWGGITVFGQGGILLAVIWGSGSLGGYLAGKKRKRGKRIKR